jgi:hypothetical protein
MKLAYAMELVVVLAIGIAFARWHIGDPVFTAADIPNRLWVKTIAEGFLTGVALIGCLGVWTEFATRRSPQPWGPGRWAWSIVGLHVISRFVFSLIDLAAWSYRSISSGRSISAMTYAYQIRMELCFRFLDSVPFMLIALGVTCLVVMRGESSIPDAREWSGRGFATLIVVSTIVFSLAGAVGY